MTFKSTVIRTRTHVGLFYPALVGLMQLCAIQICAGSQSQGRESPEGLGCGILCRRANCVDAHSRLG